MLYNAIPILYTCTWFLCMHTHTYLLLYNTQHPNKPFWCLESIRANIPLFKTSCDKVGRKSGYRLGGAERVWLQAWKQTQEWGSKRKLAALHKEQVPLLGKHVFHRARQNSLTEVFINFCMKAGHWCIQLQTAFNSEDTQMSCQLLAECEKQALSATTLEI